MDNTWVLVDITGKSIISNKTLAALIRRSDLNDQEIQLVHSEADHPQLPDMSNMDEIRGGEFWGHTIPEKNQAAIKKTMKSRSDRILSYWKLGEEFRHWAKRRAHVGGEIILIFGVKSDGQRAQFSIGQGLRGYQGRHGTKTGADFTGWAKEACDEFLETALMVDWKITQSTTPPVYISAEMVASDISGDGNEHKGIPEDVAYFVIHYITIHGKLAEPHIFELLMQKFHEKHPNGFTVTYGTNKKVTTKTVHLIPAQYIIPPITYTVGNLGTEKEAEILRDYLRETIVKHVVPLMDDRVYIEKVLRNMYGDQVDISKMNIEGAILQAFSDNIADGAHCIKMKKELGWHDGITPESFLGGKIPK